MTGRSWQLRVWLERSRRSLEERLHEVRTSQSDRTRFGQDKTGCNLLAFVPEMTVRVLFRFVSLVAHLVPCLLTAGRAAYAHGAAPAQGQPQGALACAGAFLRPLGASTLKRGYLWVRSTLNRPDAHRLTGVYVSLCRPVQRDQLLSDRRLEREVVDAMAKETVRHDDSRPWPRKAW